MVKASWNLFESIWQARNEILHSLDGHAAKVAHQFHLDRLIEIKRNATRWLAPGDRNHMAYPIGTIASWDRKRIKKMRVIMDRLCRIYKDDCELEAEGQKKLTKYGFYIIDNEMVGD